MVLLNYISSIKAKTEMTTLTIETPAIETPTIETSKKQPKFTDKERKQYSTHQHKAKFKTPEEEFAYSLTQTRKCSKCEEIKNLTFYETNTSGADGFDKSGYRMRRPECKECGKKAQKGNADAIKFAKKNGIPYKAPPGTLCKICNKVGKTGDQFVFDHCHKKNVFRGYLHNSCNRSLGVLGDDVDGILRALNYLLVSEPCKIIQNEDGSLKRA
jgi:hypothetical protein